MAVNDTVYILGGWHKKRNMFEEKLFVMPYVIQGNPDIVKQICVTDSVYPSLLSFVSKYCNITCIMKVLKNRQDIMNADVVNESSKKRPRID